MIIFLFQSFRVRHKSSTEKNLLLSRLPIEPEIMDSIATDHSDQEIKEMDLEAAGSVRSSLPINIERQFNYFRLVIFEKWFFFTQCIWFKKRWDQTTLLFQSLQFSFYILYISKTLLSNFCTILLKEQFYFVFFILNPKLRS